MRVSIVIPAYNESAIIEKTLQALTSYLDGRFGRDYELLFVDDGSRDGTRDLAAALIAEQAKTDPRSAAAEGRVLVIGYGENRGKGAAVREGMLRARGQIRLFTDCDLAYGTAVLGDLYDTLTTHAPRLNAKNGAKTVSDAGIFPAKTGEAEEYPALVAIGSRDIHPEGYRGYSPFRRFVSRTYRWVLRGFFGLTVTDSQCGIKGFTAAAAEAIFPVAETNRYAFDFEIISLADRAGIRVIEHPVCVVNNRKTRMRLFRDSFRMLRDVITTRRRLQKK